MILCWGGVNTYLYKGEHTCGHVELYISLHTSLNEPLGAKGPPLVGEEVHKKDIAKVGSL